MREKKPAAGAKKSAAPAVERLESRLVPSVTAAVVGGVLTVQGTPGKDNVKVAVDDQTGELVVRSYAAEVGRFAPAAVTGIRIDGGDGRDVLAVDPRVAVPAVVVGGAGGDILRGGGGTTTLDGGEGPDKLRAGDGATTLLGDGGRNRLFNVKPADTAAVGPEDVVCLALPVVQPEVAVTQTLLTNDPMNGNEIATLLDRAAAASASDDAVIAVVDRNGRVLGVRVEDGVDAVFKDDNALVYAVDGALAKARTGAFFANNAAPLTSRTVQFISQSTITQREVESFPSITDEASPLRGPGFVAPVGIKGHFPPNVPFTPQVDLFQIEHTNRDSILHPGADRIKGTPDDVLLPARFNIDPAFLGPGGTLYPPESYGFVSGLAEDAQSRGIGTLPGGIPIYKNNQLVGGIGVFFPGKTGFATEENSSLGTTYDPTRPDRSFEAEYIAFAAVGGAPGLGFGVGAIGAAPALKGFGLPLTPQNQRIDLVGITLDVVGPGGVRGPENLANFGRTLGLGDVNSGEDKRVTPGSTLYLDGLPVSEGWLVVPHDGVGVTGEQARKVIEDGVAQANRTRAAIRLPLNSTTRMVLAVADLNGNVVGLYRMPDATVFSIDVAVAKARNVTYYAGPDLQQADRLAGVAIGTALTNRSFRYLSLPFFPEGIDGSPPGPFSILNDGGVDPRTARTVGASQPASAYQSVQGYDAFHPGTNFRDPDNVLNQNGIVFFPGSAPVYGGEVLVGGYGISGDGVDQDDVVTVGGIGGLAAPERVRIDRVFVRGVRVPYHKFNRNPEGGVV